MSTNITKVTVFSNELRVEAQKRKAVKFTGIQFVTDCDECLTLTSCWLISPDGEIPNTKSQRESLTNRRLCNDCWVELELELLGRGIQTW